MKEMNITNLQKDKAIKFVLHNCYKDVKDIDCESEVSLHAFKSYIRYRFFRENKYKILTGSSNKGDKKFNDVTGSLNIIDNYDIGFRRETSSQYGLFFEVKFDEFSTDLQADILTSIKSPLNKIINFNEQNIDALVSDLQLQDYDKFTESKFKIIDDNLYESIKKFSCVVGTVGNMLPIPEGTQFPGNSEIYRFKLNTFYGVIVNLYGKYDKSRTKDKKRYQFLVKQCGYTGIEGYKRFINDFYLQDFLDNDPREFNNEDGKYPKISLPSSSEVNYTGRLEECCSQWAKWFDNNTKLILKRGLRIYYKGNNAKINEYDFDYLFNNVVALAQEVNNNLSH